MPIFSLRGIEGNVGAARRDVMEFTSESPPTVYVKVP